MERQMRSIPATEAARAFLAILKAAEAGEEIVITREGKPVAKLVKAGVEDTAAKPGEQTPPRMRSIGWRDHP